MSKVSSTESFSNLDEVKRSLENKGINRFYQKEQRLIVQESDEIQVRIYLNNNEVITEGVFPQIGNTVQIITSIFLIFILEFFNIPYGWIIAILLAQAISYQWHLPKITKLQNKIISSLNNRNN